MSALIQEMCSQVNISQLSAGPRSKNDSKDNLKYLVYLQKILQGLCNPAMDMSRDPG